MKAIRSSEIGTYLFCKRAWWYKRKGTKSSNRAEMRAGTEMHQHHGRQVLAAGLTRTIAIILVLAAVVLFVSQCTAQIF
jgi:CRISPR/Cas system-associated exonuclease Cas4 (RecB family)